MGLQELPDDVDRLGHGSPGAKAKLGRAKKLFRNKLEAGTENRRIKSIVVIRKQRHQTSDSRRGLPQLCQTL